MQFNRDAKNIQTHEATANARRCLLDIVHEDMVKTENLVVVLLGGCITREAIFTKNVKAIININPCYDSASRAEYE